MNRSTLARPGANQPFGFPRDQIAFRRIRVAIYKRVSTEEQLSGYGLEDQDNVTHRWVDDRSHMGYEVFDVYEDKGVSGTLIERPDLMRLGRDARAGKVDLVLVYKFDRIGRVGRAFWRWVWELEDCNVAVASATQDIDTSTPAGLLALQQYASFAEMEHGMIVERMQGGLNAKARQGGWVGGTPPYGYEIAGKGTKRSTLVISRDEAEIVMLAYEMLVSDHLGTADVARKLNVAGHQTRSGQSWDANNLRMILKENSFGGTYTFRKPGNARQTKQNLITGQTQAKFGPPIVVEIPAILDGSEVAMLADAIRRTAGKVGVKKVYAYPLSGRIFGECGRAYVGHGHTVDGVRRYVCSGNQRRHSCKDRSILADLVEEAVWADIARTLDDPERIQKWAADFVAEMPGNSDKLAARVKGLRKQIEAQDKAITTTVVTYAKQNVPAHVVGDAVTKLNEERGALVSLLDEAERALEELRGREALAKNVEALVTVAQENIREFPSTDGRLMIEMLDIRVDVKGSASSGRGRPCKITAWFTEHNLQVPESLSDTQWAQAAEQFPLSQRQSPEAEARTRAMAEAVLYKVRTGCGWADLPPGGPDPVATNVRAARWLTSGQWAAFIEALGSYTGSDPAKHRPLPPMTVTGALDLRKNAHRSTSTSMLGELSAIIPLKFSIG